MDYEHALGVAEREAPALSRALAECRDTAGAEHSGTHAAAVLYIDGALRALRESAHTSTVAAAASVYLQSAAVALIAADARRAR